MKRKLGSALMALAALLSACKGRPGASATRLQGAGASFPYPLYARWAHDYERKTGVKVNYQSIGSGGGIAQIKKGTVDFGASDAPLTKAELDEAGLLQFPMVMGGVVVVVHIAGIGAGKLKLRSQVLADIFLGKVRRWNHPAIRADNPGLSLPDKPITVVRRADGSGTTWIFTNYLSKVSADFKSKVGVGKAVRWPVGVAAKGNEGVAAYVQRVEGAIGYVEYAYAVQNKMAHVLLQNRTGRFVAPSLKSFQAAAANADWKKAPGFHVVLTDQPGDLSWPITGATFILVHKVQRSRTKARAMFRFFDWCLRHGAEQAKALGYVPLPQNVVDLVEAAWAREVTAGGKPVWP